MFARDALKKMVGDFFGVTCRTIWERPLEITFGSLQDIVFQRPEDVGTECPQDVGRGVPLVLDRGPYGDVHRRCFLDVIFSSG